MIILPLCISFIISNLPYKKNVPSNVSMLTILYRTICLYYKHSWNMIFSGKLII